MYPEVLFHGVRVLYFVAEHSTPKPTLVMGLCVHFTVSIFTRQPSPTLTAEPYPLTAERYPLTAEPYPLTAEPHHPLTAAKRYPLTAEPHPLTAEPYHLETELSPVKIVAIKHSVEFKIF